MIKLPYRYEVGDLVLTGDDWYWAASHVNQVVMVTNVDWSLELLAITHPNLNFNSGIDAYHLFKHFQFLSKKTKLATLIYGQTKNHR